MGFIRVCFMIATIYVIWFSVDYEYIILHYVQDAKLVSEIKGAVSIFQWIEFLLVALFIQNFLKD